MGVWQPLATQPLATAKERASPRCPTHDAVPCPRPPCPLVPPCRSSTPAATAASPSPSRSAPARWVAAQRAQQATHTLRVTLMLCRRVFGCPPAAGDPRLGRGHCQAERRRACQVSARAFVCLAAAAVCAVPCCVRLCLSGAAALTIGECAHSLDLWAPPVRVCPCG